LAAVNRRAVEFVKALAGEATNVDAVINGVIGPRGDGYVVGAAMSASEAAAYHGLQTRAFAEAGAEMISAITMTYAEEAIGVVRAATAVSLPVVISLTTEVDGRLPSGQTLGDAIRQIDDATGGAPAYFMVNCAHPTHFAAELDAAQGWVQRIGGIRANASRLSHAELDEATELDRGDIAELASLYRQLSAALPLHVVGGCCGTDIEHIRTIHHALNQPATN
jgi:S-methylmethionine-dependent homocysteine/selenocysteine methylase